MTYSMRCPTFRKLAKIPWPRRPDVWKLFDSRRAQLTDVFDLHQAGQIHRGLPLGGERLRVGLNGLG